jgi:hypothetical protein
MRPRLFPLLGTVEMRPMHMETALREAFKRWGFNYVNLYRKGACEIEVLYHKGDCYYTAAARCAVSTPEDIDDQLYDKLVLALKERHGL